MGFRFLHLADLHLETSFGGRPTTRERLRRATLEAFDAAIDYALEERLHALLAAGDLYDDAILSLRTELDLVQRVRRLANGGVWFLWACGNHDPGGPPFRSTRLGLDARGADPSAGDWRRRVHVFRGAQPEPVTITGADGAPVGVVVGGGHAGPVEGQNLAARFGRLRTELPVVGLLHTHVDSAEAAARHDRYAPSSAADYHRSGYSYWALGHIHVRQRAVPGLPVFYAGNLQGRNPRETGEKGGLVVEAYAGAAAEPEFVRFAPVRWVCETVSGLPADDSASALLEHLVRHIEALRAWPGEALAVRLELAGPTPLARMLRSGRQLASMAEELAERSGALEAQLRAEGVHGPLDRAAVRQSPTPVAEALALIERARVDDALLADLAPEPLARELDGDPDARRLYLRQLLDDLPEELLQRCLAGGRA